MSIDICADHPSAFWNRKKHTVTLPYEDDFSEEDIPTKSRLCQMNSELVEFCKKDIENLLQKGLIKPSKSPWSCTAFYVNNAAEKERGVPKLKKEHKKPWTDSLTNLVKAIKERVKSLPCLTLANPAWPKIVEIDASNMGYGGILKQINPHDKHEYLIRFHSGKWSDAQRKYATVAHEMLTIVKCVLKFQDDLYNQKFMIKIDAQSVKYRFDKDFKHDASKLMFARWQAQLTPFDFETLYKKGSDNSLPDFLSREYIQNE
ncbi:hypothetical protein MTR67_001662 [Solanum verrucosum]|uniref:Reverse transcriptase/retrotransposon-derived protein RNase H-like domain-containing protein n=1 Tax=Solanum verrucosum TaxID=315347 RepID=A0AAF0PP05_SOLVR|nr:hypothetical protein MTR67_001662 [Solanum verrucosum]